MSRLVSTVAVCNECVIANTPNFDFKGMFIFLFLRSNYSVITTSQSATYLSCMGNYSMMCTKPLRGKTVWYRIFHWNMICLFTRILKWRPTMQIVVYICKALLCFMLSPVFGLRPILILKIRLMAKQNGRLAGKGDLCHSFRGLISFLLILQRISLCPCCYILAEVESINFWIHIIEWN